MIRSYGNLGMATPTTGGYSRARTLRACDDMASEIDFSMDAFVSAGGQMQYYKGGVAKVLGIVVAAVVTYFTAGAASGFLATSMGMSSTVAAVAGGAIGGMVGGAAGAAVGGGNIGKGALFGAIGGGLTGGIGGSGAFSSSANEWGSSLASGSTAPIPGTGGVAAIGGADPGAVVSGGGSAVGNGGDLGFNNMLTDSGGAASTGAPSVSSSLDSAGGATAAPQGMPTSASAQLNADMGGANGLRAPGDAGAGPSLNQGGSTNWSNTNLANAPATTDVPRLAAQTGTAGSDTMLGKVQDWANQNPGMAKIGSQLVGSLAKAPGSDDMKSYLDSVKNNEAQAQQFNQNMATKKAAIGDTLQADAANIDPQYYGLQSMNATRNRNQNMLQDQMQNMRNAGMDSYAQLAEARRMNVGGAQNEATAFDSGLKEGRNQRNSTYATAGGMYSQVSTPTAGLASAYGAMSNADRQSQKDWGGAIEDATGITNSSQKKPNQSISTGEAGTYGGAKYS